MTYLPPIDCKHLNSYSNYLDFRHRCLKDSLSIYRCLESFFSSLRLLLDSLDSPSVWLGFFFLREPNQCCQIAKNHQSTRIFENSLKSCKVVTEFFFRGGGGCWNFHLATPLGWTAPVCWWWFQELSKKFCELPYKLIDEFCSSFFNRTSIFCSFFQFLG